MADDIQILQRLATIEAKLDNVLTIIPDHEQRIRLTEQYREECRQDNRIGKLEDRVTVTEDKIDSHLSETLGTVKATQWMRDLAMVAAGAVATWIITDFLPGVLK